MKKTVCLILTAALLALSLYGCSLAPQRFSATSADAFDTVTNLVAYDTREAHFNECAAAVEAELARYSRLFDIYREYDGVTNLCTLNKTAAKAPVRVEREILDLLLSGKRAYKESGGRLNICCGAVLKLWHDAREAALDNPEKAYLPSEEALNEAAKHIDPDDLIIDEENSTVFFQDGALQLDVGATAKGFTAERLKAFILEKGYWADFMLNLGGNVVCAGYKNGDGKSKWRVQLENPDQSSDTPLETLSVTDCAVVTSGDYQRYFTYEGRRYCHIIDMNTRMPAAYCRSVSVIAASSETADVLSTALFLMPVDEGLAYIETLDGAEALWVTPDGETVTSSGFSAYKVL